jgi:hypothetical protein
MRDQRTQRFIATCWNLAGALFLANFFLHKPVSDVCDALSARFGFATYNRAALLLIAGASLLAAAPLLPLAGRWLRQPRGLGVALTLVAMTVAAHRWLLVANIELIHFPQYALLTGLLFLGGLSPDLAWLAATGSGVLDEVYQHLVIYAGRPDTYLDYNDMVLNAIGAAWVAILVAAARSKPSAPGAAETSAPGRRRTVGRILLAVTLFTVVTDPPQLHPFYRRAATGFDYRVLSAGEALAVATLLWTIITAVSAACRSSATTNAGVGGAADLSGDTRRYAPGGGNTL